MSSALVSIVMGSDSDLEIMREAGKALEEFGIGYEIDVTSAHRSRRAYSGLRAKGGGARDSGDYCGSWRGGASGGRDCGAYDVAGDRRADSFDFAAGDGFFTRDGADAGGDSGGNGCDW